MEKVTKSLSWDLANFQTPRTGLKIEVAKTLPSSNKPTTGKFGGTRSPKSLLLDSGQFSEAWYGPQNQYYGKMKEKKNVRG